MTIPTSIQINPIKRIETMTMQLNKGISADTFKNKVDTVLRDGKITAKEFKELAKDVVGGEATLMQALQKISPKFDKKYIESTELPTDRTTSVKIKKDDLAIIFKNVTSGEPVTMSKNKKEMTSLTDQINLLRAETGDENIKEGTPGGKLLGALEIIHGSAVELTKGGLEGKDKLAAQTKDLVGFGNGTLPKPEDINPKGAFEISKDVMSMGSCVVTFASTVMAIKEAVGDGAHIKDLEAVKNTLTAQLRGSPTPSVEVKAEIKSKIAALDECISIMSTSKKGNITEAIGQAISTAGGLMEFSKAVAPHLANSVEFVGNGVSAFSGIVTGVATTIKESVRLDDNRGLKSRAKEFLQNPAKAMLKDKEKEAKIMTDDLKMAKSIGKELSGEKAGLEKQLVEAKKLPDSTAKTIQVNRLKGEITTVKGKITVNDNDITKLQDTIDVIRGDNKVNKDLKKELEGQVTALKAEKKGLDDSVTGRKGQLERNIRDFGIQKTTLTDKKTTLETEKTGLGTEKTQLEQKKAILLGNKSDLMTELNAAKALPKDDITRTTEIAKVEGKITAVSREIAVVNGDISQNNTKITDNDKAINSNKAALEKNKADTDSATTSLGQVVARIADITTEVADPGGVITKKIADTQAKIDNTVPKSPELEKLAGEIKQLNSIAAIYEKKDKTPDEIKLCKTLGVSKEVDDIGSQVVKRRSIGHSVLGIVKGLLATAGGVAATIGAIAGTVLLAATPVGWALAGAGAVIGIGMLGYKVYKTIQRNKTEASLQEQSKELGTMSQSIQTKLTANNPPIPASEQTKMKDKIKEIDGLKARVDSMLLKKSPTAAKESIINALKADIPTTEPDKTIKTEEKNAMKKFVQHVFKLDPDILVPPSSLPPTSTPLTPEQTKMQLGMMKILEKKMPMFA